MWTRFFSSSFQGLVMFGPWNQCWNNLDLNRVWHVSVALTMLLYFFFVDFLVYVTAAWVLWLKPKHDHIQQRISQFKFRPNCKMPLTTYLGTLSLSGSSVGRPLSACQGTIDVLNVTDGQRATSMITNGVEAVPGQRPITNITSEYRKHKAEGDKTWAQKSKFICSYFSQFSSRNTSTS
jgi:hypothetical protein